VRIFIYCSSGGGDNTEPAACSWGQLSMCRQYSLHLQSLQPYTRLLLFSREWLAQGHFFARDLLKGQSNEILYIFIFTEQIFYI
jgi:hypothetical protein